jgi:hypothetical protein
MTKYGNVLNSGTDYNVIKNCLYNCLFTLTTKNGLECHHPHFIKNRWIGFPTITFLDDIREGFPDFCPFFTLDGTIETEKPKKII